MNAPALALVPPPKSDPPESIVRPAHPAQVAEEIDVEAEARILAAIEKLDGKVDGILQQQAGQAEWRKTVDEDRVQHERRLDDLEERDHERELSIVKITAWAAGAGAASAAIVGTAIAIAAKLLGH